MMLGTCDRCKRTGRAENLTFINNKALCPPCLEKEPKEKQRYNFMLYKENHGKKQIQLMDFETGKLFIVHEDDYKKRLLDEGVLKVIDDVWEDQILSRSHFYSK